jgi:hypothetical protein
MRVLICGDRNWDDGLPIAWIVRALAHGPDESTVIEGEARGADSLAGRSAERQGVPVEKYPADWDAHGKAAGPIRNQQMLDDGRPDIVVAFHDDLDNSRGTGDMVRRATKAGIPVYNIRRVPPRSMASPSEHS